MKHNPLLTSKTLKDPLWKAKNRAINLAELLKNNKIQGEEKILSFLEDILKMDEAFQKVALSWLIKNKVFNSINSKKIFEYSIKCLKANKVKILNDILKATKLQSPLKEDLGFFVLKGGDTLGHLAAKLDNQKVLSILLKLNPDYLRVKNNDGDTIPHIASKFLSQKSIEFLVEKYPGLFWVRNNKGLKPSDLEGGPLIKNLIKEESIAKAWGQDNEIYIRSLNKLKNAIQSTPLPRSKNTKAQSKTLDNLIN